MNSKEKGLSITEILVALSIFIIAMFSVVLLYYSAMRINTNSNLAEAAMQNIDIIQSFVRVNRGVLFSSTLQSSTNDFFTIDPSLTGLIQSTPANNNQNFVALNSPPLNSLQFVKANVFQRHIRVESLWNREGRNFNLVNLGYHRVWVYTVIIRWRDKNNWRSVRKIFSVSNDEVM